MNVVCGTQDFALRPRFRSRCRGTLEIRPCTKQAREILHPITRGSGGKEFDPGAWRVIGRAHDVVLPRVNGCAARVATSLASQHRAALGRRRRGGGGRRPTSSGIPSGTARAVARRASATAAVCQRRTCWAAVLADLVRLKGTSCLSACLPVPACLPACLAGHNLCPL